jgi:hypothetical protein
MVFEHDSYPWDVRRLRVPATVFQGGHREFRLDFSGEDTAEDIDLPPGALVGFDWIELGPVSPARLLPAPSLWLWSLLLPVAIFATLRWAGVRSWITEVTLVAALVVVAFGHVHLCGLVAGALDSLWIVFPLGVLTWAIMRFVLKVGPKKARTLSAVFTLVLLAHSTILFFPNHIPPDLIPHLGQIRYLESGRWNLSQFWEFSSSFGESGRGKPHFGADYRAPYPPWTYFLVQGLRLFMNRPRFLLELLAMTSSAIMVLFVYGLSRRLAADSTAAAYATALAALEISIWHHASRAHTPGSVGQVFFLAAVFYLVYRQGDFQRTGTIVRFALLSLAATIAYAATLFHFVIFIAWLVFLDLVAERSWVPGRQTVRMLIGAVSGTCGSFALFYYRFVGTATANRQAIFAAEGYHPPATFFFLRNQMRDTVQILRFGYPGWVLLAVPAYLKLRDWTTDSFARRVIMAWTATYGTLLVLKDPVFFPQLFLHAKEDLLYAPLLCVMGGMTLARLHSKGRRGKIAVAAVLIALACLQARDYTYNSDMVNSPGREASANKQLRTDPGSE